MNARILPAAKIELDAAAAYFESCQPGLGLEFVAEFERAIGEILEFPYTSRNLTKSIRRRKLRRFPYGIVYRILGGTVEIGAVVHLHRRPMYWVKRFK